MKSVYENVDTTFNPEAKTLTIVISTDPEVVTLKESNSKKNLLVATTGGAVAIAGMKLNLNLYRSK